MSIRSTVTSVTFGVTFLIVAMLAAPALAQSNDARAAAASERGVQFYRPGDYSLTAAPTDHDIVLMEPYHPWYLTVHGEVDFTNNAFLTSPKHADTWASATVDGGFETTIAESFDIQIGAQLSAARFNHYSQLDTDSIAGIVAISKTIDSVRYGVEYIPSQYFGRGFDERSLNANELAVYGRYIKPFDNQCTGVLYARLSRRWTYPHDYTNDRLAVTAAVQHECTPQLVVNAGLTLAYSVYDNYFQNITGERRRELLVTPFISCVYQINGWSTVGIALSYGRNYSSIDAVDYEAASISPYVELNWRF